MTIRIKKPSKRNKKLLSLFLIIPVLILTLATATQPQRFLQFAQSFTVPPLFGCLQVGEGNPGTCASKLGKLISESLTLHGRPLTSQTVYYGDRIGGSLVYKNVGDVPLQISRLSVTASSLNQTTYSVLFQPTLSHVNLTPGQTATLANSSYRFNAPDPNGPWTAGVSLNDGSSNASLGNQQQFTVNATCTALRIQELTSTDKSDLQALCAKTPTSPLCSSREYCEIFKGSGCTQPNVSDETPGWDCDPGTYLPVKEQNLLEELCKTYPDADACKDFCDRTIGSSLCPKKYLFIDTFNGKPITYNNPHVLYVRDPNNFKFTYAKDYPPDKFRMPGVQQLTMAGQAVAGAETSNLIAQAPGAGAAGNNPANFPAGTRSTGANGNSTAPGANVNQGGACTPGAPGCPASGVSAPTAPGPNGYTPGPAVNPGAPQAAAQLGVPNAGRTGPASTPLAVVAAPLPPPPCGTANGVQLKRLKNGSCGICDAGDIQCEAQRQQDLSKQCPKDPTSPTGQGSYVPGNGGTFGCRVVPPSSPPATPDGAPYQCGLAGQPLCSLERNNLPPDPANGRVLDPTYCSSTGAAIVAGHPCTSLSVPETSQAGDLGYDPSCSSARRDSNPNDDPAGVPQFACCANSLSLREGCCGQACEVWSETVQPGGTIQYRDYFHSTCTNDVANSNTCQRSRAQDIPTNLQGTSGQNPQPGFLPQDPGTLNAPCNDVQTCNAPLICQGAGGKGSNVPGKCVQPSTGTPGSVNGPGSDQTCHNQGQWYDPAKQACVPADFSTPPNSIADGQPAQCGVCNTVPGFNGCAAQASVCCRNSCQSGACHVYALGSTVTCGAIQEGFFSGYNLYTPEPGFKPAPDTSPQSTITCKNSPDCASLGPTAVCNLTTGKCEVPATNQPANNPPANNPPANNPPASPVNPVRGSLGNGDTCNPDLNGSDCMSGYCNGLCENPAHSCTGAGIQGHVASDCCSLTLDVHSGVCAGPNPPGSVPLGTDGLPMDPATAAQAEASAPKNVKQPLDGCYYYEGLPMSQIAACCTAPGYSVVTTTNPDGTPAYQCLPN